MNLHNEIMNIPCNPIPPSVEGPGNVNSNPYMAYKEGHRDARHAAAELSLKAEAKIEELESQIKELQQRVSDYGWEASARHSQQTGGWQ